MDQSPRITAAQPPLAVDRRGFDLAAVGLVWAAYSIVLGIANDLDFVSAVAGGAANAIPFMLFGAAARRLIIDRLVGRTLSLQILGHAGLATAYALLAYWLVLVLLGLLNGTTPFDFEVRSFPERASAWQLLQNVTTYGLIAAISYLQARSEQVTLILNDPAAAADEGRGLTRYFIRSGDDIHPVNVTSIISITGADDYAEVATVDGRHLARMTLAELEQSLDPAVFLRIHRSHIVNVDRIARAEPAGGGRLLLHMEDGEAIPASRAGARKLRDRLL